MRLIEQGSVLRSPLFYAENIADMVRSRDEVLVGLNPALNEPYQKVLQSGSPRYSGDLGGYFPDYDQGISVMLPRVNHDSVEDHDVFGMKLFDRSGYQYVHTPDKFGKFLLRLRYGEEVDFDFWKNTLWMHRPVWLRGHYFHTAVSALQYHETKYELEFVYNLPRPGRAAKQVRHQLPKGLHGLVEI